MKDGIKNFFENPWDDTPPNDKSQNEKKTTKDTRGINFIMWDSKNSGNKNNLPNGKSIKLLLLIIIMIPLLAFLSTGFYQIHSYEEGVVVRFGEYNRTSCPGLNYKIPDPIEKVTKVSVESINRDIIGARTDLDDSSFRQKNTSEKLALSIPEESRMLTGDENIIDMHFSVQWRVKDAYNYVFKIRDNPFESSTLKSGAESAMREVIGTVKLHEAISEQRQSIEKKAAIILQKILDDYNTGIEVVNVSILHSYVPPEVIDAYRDIQAAKADRETSINKADAYRNDIIPKASGEADAIIERAKASKAALISNAQGQANKFASIYTEYKISPDITRKRLYIEVMEQILSDKDKILVTKNIGNSTLPILPLQDMLSQKNEFSNKQK